MKDFQLEIYTPSKSVYSGMVKSVSVPGSLGAFQVLFNHAPIISSLEIGEVKILEQDETNKTFATSGGTIEVTANKVLLLAETFESSEQINIERAQAALERAKDRMNQKNNPEIDKVRAEAALKRALNRMKVAKSVV